MTTILRQGPCINSYSIDGEKWAGAVFDCEDIESCGYFGFVHPDPGNTTYDVLISNVNIECIADCY